MAYGDLLQARVAESAGASVSLAYLTSPATGSTLVAAGGSGGDAAITLAGTTNTWTQQADQHSTGGQQISHRQAYVLSHAGGGETVDLTGGVDETIVGILEFEGTSDSAPLTNQNSNTVPSFGTAINTGTVAVTTTHLENGNVLLVGTATAATSQTCTPGTDWTERIEETGLTSLHVQSRVVSSAASYASLATWAGSNDHFERITAFKPALAAAAPLITININPRIQRMTRVRPAAFSPGRAR